MTIKYTIEAKPTFYNGVQFRSRLEARWAVFFDATGYKWQYEPVDFGNWSPDFLIENHAIDALFNKLEMSQLGKVYVEVKPITAFDKDTADKMLRSPAPSMWLLGLGPEYCWSTDSGSWYKGPLVHEPDAEFDKWKQAGNIVQWHHS